MIVMKTVNGEEFQIEWAGVANIDGVLRFSVKNAELSDIITAFTNPANCQTLTRVFDEDEKTFEGYSVFRGVQINYSGAVIVSMSKI